jgi:endonuclease/exonuclease/phosphatase (EEP) superfamily protein YafD
MLPAVTLLLLQGFVVADEPARSFRVATYNLNWGNRRGDEVLDAIGKSKADVVFLQETTPQSEQFLRQRLKRSYRYFHAAGHQGRYGAERFVFLSKLPLRDLAFHPPEKCLFGFYTAVCDFGDTPVRLANVHLTPFLIPRDSSILEAMAAVGRIAGPAGSLPVRG